MQFLLGHMLQSKSSGLCSKYLPLSAAGSVSVRAGGSCDREDHVQLELNDSYE